MAGEANVVCDSNRMNKLKTSLLLKERGEPQQHTNPTRSPKTKRAWALHSSCHMSGTGQSSIYIFKIDALARMFKFQIGHKLTIGIEYWIPIKELCSYYQYFLLDQCNKKVSTAAQPLSQNILKDYILIPCQKCIFCKTEPV